MSYGDDLWNEFNLSERITDILSDVTPYETNHRLGLPGMTPYQIALEFVRLFPDDFEEICQRGLGIGGKGSGNRISLSQFIGRQLSQRIDDLPDLEGFFLSYEHISEILFRNGSRKPQAFSDNIAVSVFRFHNTETA